MKYIELTLGQRTIVDDDIYELLIQYKWRATNQRGKYYAVSGTWRKGTYIYMHRLVLGLNQMVDHINRNTLDNRKENLRPCTNQENIRNSKRKNKTGFKGVKYRKDLVNKPYCARINIDSKQLHLGYFSTAIEAAKAYNEAAIKYFGKFANLNEF